MASSGIRSVNVFAGRYEEGRHPHGARTRRLMLHQGEDRRHLAFASEIPDGASFTETRAGIEEVFYIVRGTARCELESGEAFDWAEGDLVYWPYDQPMKIEYSPGSLAVCLFWSDQPISLMPARGSD
jgi:mannose-6-phosphate isomerase-like protein (cupin superfamily)